MFMRVSWGRVEPGKWDEYEAAYRQGAGRAGKSEGMLAHRLLRDIDDPDTGYTVMVWDTRENMEAYENSSNRATRLEPIQPFFPAAFVVNRLEVVIDESFEANSPPKPAGERAT
jgi:heme-degrading monooxygenase HmoA